MPKFNTTIILENIKLHYFIVFYLVPALGLHLRLTITQKIIEGSDGLILEKEGECLIMLF